MKTEHCYSITAALIALAISAAAAENSLDLNQCVNIGLENNLKLRNKAIEKLIAEAGVSRAEAIYDTSFSISAQHSDTSIPDPGSFLTGDKELTELSAELTKAFSSGTKASISAGYSKYVIPGNEFIEIPPYHANISLSLSQSLLRNSFGSLDRSKVEYAEYAGIIAENIYEREKDILELRITEAYWDLYSAHYNLSEAKTSLELAKKLLRTNIKKEEDGLLDETDILAAKALIETRNVEILALDHAKENAADKLKNLIQLPLDQRDSTSFILTTDQQELLTKEISDKDNMYLSALENRPDISALKHVIKQSGLDIDMKKNNLKPNLDIIGSLSKGDTDAEQSASMDIEEDAWMLGLRFQTPLSRKMAKSDLRISNLALEKANNDLKNLQDGISLECAMTRRACDSAFEMVKATERANKLYETRLELEQEKFDQGRSDTRWVIEAQDSQIHMRIQHHTALANYQKAKAGYFVAQGLSPIRSRK